MVRRNAELYKLVFEKTSNKKLSRLDELIEFNIMEDFLSDFYNFYAYADLMERKKEIPKKKMCIWIDSMIEEEFEDESQNYTTRKICMHYIKHSKRISVKNRVTLEETFKKGINDGDDEKQHYIIRTVPEKNVAVFVWEKILGAICIKDINSLFKNFYRKWIKEKFKDNEDKLDILKKFHPEIYAIPSADFLKELETVDNINLLDATIKANNRIPGVDFIFSNEEELKKDMHLIRKSETGYFYRKNDIISCYRKYRENDNIIRMVIHGKRNGASITLDTEKMRFKERIELLENDDGLIDTDFLYKEYEKTLNNFCDFILNQDIHIELVESD